MSDRLRNGENPNRPGRGLIQPPFRLPEVLIDDLYKWARAYGEVPGDFIEDILREGLRARMFPSDAVVYSGPSGPIRVQKLENKNPIKSDGFETRV